MAANINVTNRILTDKWLETQQAIKADKVTDVDEILKAMKPQTDEFDALDKLISQYKSLPAIVDDGYPKARHYYESAVKTFIEACKANGR